MQHVSTQPVDELRRLKVSYGAAGQGLHSEAQVIVGEGRARVMHTVMQYVPTQAVDKRRF
jgi:hypothetical protein